MVDWKNSPDLSTPLDADHLTQAFADERANERAYQSSTYALLSATPVRIAQVVVGTAAATIDFTSIPAGYETLTLDVMGRGSDAAALVNLMCRLNADSGGNYDYQVIEGVGAATVIDANAQAATFWRLGGFSSAGATANKASVAHVVIPSYARTVFQKTMISTPLGVTSQTTTAITLDFTAGVWRSTAAINQITLLLSAGSFVTGTVATLYATP